jgi:hypothetical protein
MEDEAIVSPKFIVANALYTQKSINFSLRNSREQWQVGDDPIAFIVLLVRDLCALGLRSHDREIFKAPSYSFQV